MAHTESKFAEDFTSENMYQPESVGDSPQRHSTLKKKNSISRKSSVKQPGQRKSRSASVTSRISTHENFSSPFYTPVPTHSSPTDTLAIRFQAWRRVLKDFITYFKEVQAQQEVQSKSILKLSQAMNHTVQPEEFMKSGGLMEANAFLRSFHKEAYLASENARSAEAEIINHLNRLRGDLSLKIKEIKALSGDFKNSVDKEKEATRRAILQLTDSLTALESNPRSIVGKNEPYIIRLHVEKQLRRQLSEENYLHRAYQNLESSGRELESIVVGEIQNAFDSYIKIIKQSSQFMHESASKLTQILLQLPPDREWSDFVQREPAFIGAGIPLRSIEDIEYPGCKHPGTMEVRSGSLERKTKYLRQYTAGWYVLSPTHLHEFKTPDRANDLSPVLSLYLQECQLGSHTSPETQSHKFLLWGRQVGPMHTRHKWTFRAESHGIMFQWYEDIRKFIELSSQEQNAFIVAEQNLSSTDGEASGKEEDVEDGLENDEADEIPYSTSTYTLDTAHVQLRRPEGGRFPSDIQLQRGLTELERPHSSDSDHSVYVTVPENTPKSEQPHNHIRNPSAPSYNEAHPYTQAPENKQQHIVPVMAEIPPTLEHHLHNYEENVQPTANHQLDSTTG